MFRKTLIAIAIISMIFGCSQSEKKENEIKVGGIYLSKNDDESFSVSKVIALDDFAVHIAMYQNSYKSKPTDINSKELNLLIGHAPMDKEGFLKDFTELLKIEKVLDSELEGYNYYLKHGQR